MGGVIGGVTGGDRCEGEVCTEEGSRSSLEQDERLRTSRCTGEPISPDVRHGAESNVGDGVGRVQPLGYSTSPEDAGENGRLNGI